MQKNKFNVMGSVVVGAMLALSGCGDSSDNNDNTASVDASGIVTDLGTDIRTAYTTLASDADTLYEATVALENSQTDDNTTAIEAVQDAWKTARVSWESGEGFIFGPVESLGIDPAVDSWPLNTSDLAYWTGVGIASNEAAAQLGNDVRGFHAIEYLIFGDGSSTNTRTSIPLAERQYLRAVTHAFKEQIALLADTWTTDGDPETAGNQEAYYVTFTEYGSDNEAYPSQYSVIEELLEGVIGIVDEVGNGKIADPFGESSATSDVSKVESQYSWNSTTDFYNNIRSVQNIWNGVSGSGLYDYFMQREKTSADAVTSQIDTALAAIAAISDNDGDGTIDADVQAKAFRNQITSGAGRQLIQSAIDELATLQSQLESLRGTI